jgi:hypothetical protein
MCVCVHYIYIYISYNVLLCRANRDLESVTQILLNNINVLLVVCAECYHLYHIGGPRIIIGDEEGELVKTASGVIREY